MNSSEEKEANFILSDIEIVLFSLNEAPREDEIRLVFNRIDQLKNKFQNKSYEMSFVDYFFAEFGSWCHDLRSNITKIRDPEELHGYSNVLKEFNQMKYALIGEY